MNNLQISPAVSLQGEGLLHLKYLVTDELAAALAAIEADFPGRFTAGSEGTAVEFTRLAEGPEGFRIEVESDRLIIFYQTIPCALRALASVMGNLSQGSLLSASLETTPFRSRGVMIDTSRNGVPQLSTLRTLLRRMALMGLNRLFLYCEDTLRVPGEPFIGYFRGGYAEEDLRALDDYAFLFGIEIVPCIQTLGHMEQVLQWPEYWPLRDTQRVLLADEAGTYAFLDKLIQAASAPFRSRRIHIGLDEAHGIGSGIYRQKHGPCRPFDVLISHLKEVAAICHRRGLDPMIWSDMFFRLGSETNNYYDKKSSVPPGTAEQIPDGVDLVYWDYYHRDESFYQDWIGRHRAMSRTPLFATGVWTWNRFWAQLPHSLATIEPGMAAARAGSIEEVLATLWGDDGMECDLLSALPGLEFFAGQCFGTATDAMPSRFRGSCDADWNAWQAASTLDDLDPTSPCDGEAANLSKLLLWHDPLLGFLEKHLPAGLPTHYAKQKTLLEAAAILPGANERLTHPAMLADFLSLKAELHETLRPAYQKRDLSRLRSILNRLIPALLRSLSNLHESHRRLWRELYQPFGWDVLDRRYGGLAARLGSLSLSLTEHCETGLPIAELDLEPLTVTNPAQWPDFIVSHARTASPSAIS